GVVALCGAGRIEDARKVIARMERFVAGGTAGFGTNRGMTAEIGLPVSRAVVAFTEQRYDDVVDRLLPIRSRFHHFGGSHAQRDLLQRTITEAAIRADRLELARAPLRERPSRRHPGRAGWVAAGSLA